MKIMKMTIVLLVLAGISFAVSYFVSLRASASMMSATATTMPSSSPTSAPAAMVISNINETDKEQQLDDLVKELRRKIEECKRQQEDLDHREQRMQIANESFKKRAEELEAIRLQLVTPLATLKEAQSVLQQSRVLVSQQEKINLKHTAAIYEKMEPAKCGRIVMDMCGGNQEDDAAKILHFMTERAAAKLLAEIADKGLAARLCDRLKRMQEES